MNVKICSRRAAEELLEQGFPEHTAAISFYDPPSKRNAVQPLDYQVWHGFQWRALLEHRRKYCAGVQGK